MSGHTYFYFSEVKPRLELPQTPSLDDLYQLLVNGTPLGVGDETLGEPALNDGEAAADGEASDGAEASGADGEGGNSEAADEAEAAEESQDEIADTEDEDEPPSVK